MKPIVIIGSGLAGYTLAREFRKLDKITPLRIVTADDGAFYSKPMLSNALSAGKAPEQLSARSAQSMAEELQAAIDTHSRVEAIDPEARTLAVGGETLAYASLVLALGADPVRLPLQGDAAGEVLSVNDLADYARFRRALQDAGRVAVIGAGLIGCEFANDLAAAGYAVEVADPGGQPLASLLPAAAGEAVRRALADAGVAWHSGKRAEVVEHAARGYRMTFSDGSAVEVDVVLSAVGLRPRTMLAQAAGIAVNRGIVADSRLQTSAPDVYAIGDCVETDNLVLPFVLPLMQQARTLARTLAGSPAQLSYPAMPVVVKTPACPVAAVPPPAGCAGEWRVEGEGNDVRAGFHDESGVLRGFALTGRAVAEKNTFVQRLGQA